MENPLEFGIVITREDGSIERFLEKPGWGQVFSDTINTGIYVLEPEIFDYIPEGRSVDFSEEVFPAVLSGGKPLFGYVSGGYWEDVGTVEAYLRAHQDILDEKVAIKFLLPAAVSKPDVLARFEREARAAVKIKSEHVARVIDVGRLETGAPYMVMEYLDGGDLRAWVRERGAMAA